MKKLLFALVVIAAFFSAADAQRCGSFMGIKFLDKTGKPVKSDGKYKVKMTVYNDKAVNAEDLLKSGALLENDRLIKYLSFRTMCGITLAQFEVSYKTEKMTLKIRRVPSDVDFSIEAPKFAKGVFEIDFENNYKNFRRPESKPGETSEIYTLAPGLEWKKIQ